ncbi:uncharacterized protein TNCV_3085091 [Trichonephila clavipes]|nr:uncharacterized protein TNCV_3085091 [Trichonephila clavipes]
MRLGVIVILFQGIQPSMCFLPKRYMAKCSNLLLLTLSFQVIGILIPYISVLQKNIFSPPLPFISQTVGFSPECGIFTFFLVPGSFFVGYSSGGGNLILP